MIKVMQDSYIMVKKDIEIQLWQLWWALNLVNLQEFGNFVQSTYMI